MAAPTKFYIDHWREDDGRWCVLIRRANGKRSWIFGATEAEALERAKAESRQPVTLGMEG